jgi:hypothetical protein
MWHRSDSAIDSIVVIRAAIAALGNAPVHVVLTTGAHHGGHGSTMIPICTERESNGRRVVARGAPSD